MDYFIANFAQSLPMAIPGFILVYFFRDNLEGLVEAIFAGAIGSSVLPLIGYLSVGVPHLDVAALAGIWGGLFGSICNVVMRGKKERLAASQSRRPSASSIPKPASSDAVLELRSTEAVKNDNVGNATNPENPTMQEKDGHAMKESVEKRLEKVKKLLEDDLISPEDAAEKRKKILDEL